MSACAPRLNPFDWISVASWPNNSSVWNPALNFVGSYGLSSTSASALSMKRFCRRSYRRPTIAVSPMLRPEYEYDPSAKPVSLSPANEVSRWFTAAGAGGGSAFFAVVSAGAGGALCATSAAGARSQRLKSAALILPRSEEHTSEIQSRLQLVLRLLL